MQREQTLIPVDMDQEEVALRFQKYALISAAVVDASGRLVGMITVDDIVHIIQEEASEDALLLSGVDEGDINEPVVDSYKSRVRWLLANLITALVAATIISMFEETISRMVALAALMPIVAGVGGNAGTQTLAVTVRALATNQLPSPTPPARSSASSGRASQRRHDRGRDRRRRVCFLRQSDPRRRDRGGDAGQHHHRGLAGVLVPLGLDRAGADPAVASSVFVTMVTDSMGFLVFLGLASASGMVS
jgi:magnesium transporter